MPIILILIIFALSVFFSPVNLNAQVVNALPAVKADEPEKTRDEVIVNALQEAAHQKVNS